MTKPRHLKTKHEFGPKVIVLEEKVDYFNKRGDGGDFYLSNETKTSEGKVIRCHPGVLTKN